MLYGNTDAAKAAVEILLEFIGEDTDRPDLADTPTRVAKAWMEMTAGYEMNPKEILSTCFEDNTDELIVVRGIEFTSLCEHHVLPFVGTATVGYIPTGRIVGLSKIPRLVECFAKRLQVQERMTRQIAEAMVDNLAPLGVGVVVQASHSCMGCRGVRQPSAQMVTSSVLGALRDVPQARAEFLSLAHA
jgi:GTP cyclohydrolase I